MKRIHIFAATALALSGVVNAQDINTEITIEREVVPEQRAAARPDVMPRLQLPQVDPVNLSLSDRSYVTSVPPYMSRLQPAAFGAPAAPGRHRGYVSGGYLPVYNLDLSAGYRLWQTDCAAADVFGQFNGVDYDRLHRNSFMLGAAFEAQTGADGRFRAMADFGQSHYNQHEQLFSVENKSRFSVFDLTAGYDGRVGPSVDLNVGAAVNMADYSTHMVGGNGNDRSNRQWRFGLTAGIDWHSSDVSSWGIDVGGTFIAPDYCNQTLDHDGYGQSCFKKASFRVVPHYRYVTPVFDVRLGLSVNGMYAVSSGKPCEACQTYRDRLHLSDRTMLAPELSMTWRPSASFAAWIDWTARGEDNFLGTVYHAMPYGGMAQVGGFSCVPVDVKFGVNFGPWKGVSLQVRAGYADAEDWLMPTGDGNRLGAVDLESLMLGGELCYDYRSVLSIKVAYDRILNDGDYYLWRDGAGAQLAASLDVRPVDRLGLRLSWLNRVRREAQVVMWSTGYGQDEYPTGDYGTLSSLDLRADYSVNSRLGVFMSLENLLAKRWLLAGGVPSQKLHGLIGVTYTF